MSAETHPKLSQVHAEGSLILNVTVSHFKLSKNAIIPKTIQTNTEQQFDGIDLSKQSNQTLDSMPFLEFDRFQVMNATSAMESGILNKTDGNCAESSPNFALSTLSEYVNPSVFRTNEDALHAAGLSRYVDLVSFTVKPLRSDVEFGGMSVAAWEIGEHPHNVYEVYMGWYLGENGAYGSFPVAPRDYFEGWGEKVNYIEMSAYTIDEDDDYKEVPWPFCLDDIVFELRDKGDDE
jgi:hypothetical protein